MATAAPAAGKSTLLIPCRRPRVYLLTRDRSIARHKTPVVSRRTENAWTEDAREESLRPISALRLALGLGEAAATHHSTGAVRPDQA
jgi:hypothetical protein